jgi:hypothetical protein
VTSPRSVQIAFKAADSILGSLSWIPGVDQIKELKEGLEVGVVLAELEVATATEDETGELRSHKVTGKHGSLA